MNVTIGNQPLSSGSLLGWLAGIIDGEGCLQLAKQKYKDKFHFRPQLVIGNTNPIIIDKLVEIARSNNLPVYLLNRSFVAQNSRAEYVILQVMGLKRIKQWLEVVSPYLFGKKEQAKIILDYINYRLSLPNPAKGIVRFGEKDLQYKSMLDEANHRFRTRTDQRLHAERKPLISDGIV